MKKKIFTTTLITILITSILMPGKISLSAANVNNAPVENINAASNSKDNINIIKIKTPLDDLLHPHSFDLININKVPTTSIVGIPIKIQINKIYSCLYDEINIEGKNGYKIPLAIDNNNNEKNNSNSDNCNFLYDTYTWTPDCVGIFNIVAYLGNESVATRKIYVNSNEDTTGVGYLQLGDLSISDNEDSTSISTTINSTPKTEIYDKNPGQIKFVIGEPCVWSREIKNSFLEDNPLYTSYGISEKADGFKFNKGIYHIDAFLKGIYSIEYEDVKETTYRKSGLDSLKLTLSKEEIDKNSNAYRFTANVTGIDENIESTLLYAFILWDKDGWRLVQDYSNKNTYEFTPDCILTSGKYRIYARVKQYDQNNNLPNSYEAETSMELEIKPICNTNIEIKNVTITAYVANSKDNGQKKDSEIKYYKENNMINKAVSHEMNVIDIDATGCGILHYKAYAVHDGYCYSLCDYSPSSSIAFYPKSSGEYKLIILVKDLLAGSENARREINITVVDIEKRLE